MSRRELRRRDVPGEPMGAIVKKEEMQEIYAGVKFTFEKKEETKTICGFVCTRYDIKMYNIEEDEETEMTIYTTTEIGNSNDINNTLISYPGLTGFPMCLISEKDDVKTIQEVTEVKKAKIKAVDFLVPSKYKIYDSQEEMSARLQELFGSGE